jgi:predicted Zn finger-like uncharacterized protein
MILTCPSCAAQFTVDPEKLGVSGRRVRCGKCKNEWLATRPLITLPDDNVVIPPTRIQAMGAGLVTPPVTHATNFDAKRNAMVAGLLLAVLFSLPFFFFLPGKLHWPDFPGPLKNAPPEKSVVQESHADAPASVPATE